MQVALGRRAVCVSGFRLHEHRGDPGCGGLCECCVSESVPRSERILDARLCESSSRITRELRRVERRAERGMAEDELVVSSSTRRVELLLERRDRDVAERMGKELPRGKFVEIPRAVPTLHEDNPDAHLDDLADSIMYAGHPYAVASDGTIASIKAITRDDLAKWHDARLTKENLLLVVVGNVTRADLEKKIAAALGSLPATGGTARVVGPAVAKPGDVKVVQRDLPTNYILGVFPVPSLAERDFAAFRLGMAILSDRLFEEVRTKRNLTYAVSTGVSSRRANQGNLYVTAVQPDTTLKVMLGEVRRLQREPLAAYRTFEKREPSDAAVQQADGQRIVPVLAERLAAGPAGVVGPASLRAADLRRLPRRPRPRARGDPRREMRDHFFPSA